MSTVVIQLDEDYEELGLYRYSDHSTDWLPCKIVKKYPKKNKNPLEIQIKNDCAYFGVIFQRFPESISIFFKF